MSFDDFIKVTAEKLYQVYREMTGKSAKGIDIQRTMPPYTVERYHPAIAIPYENKAQGFEGCFVLIFDKEDPAVELAAAIGRYMGMPAVEKMDEGAISILLEFMNTVAGKVITEWEALGRQADFGSPKYLSDFCLHDQASDTEVYHASLILKREASLSIFTLFREKAKAVLKDKKILVVDDSKMIRHLLTTEFEKQGCQVSEAQNGLDAFVRNQADHPDLIIMDLVMPKMGGLEAIARIREMNPSVHIIVLTSTSKKEEVLAAAKHKVKGYVIKPIQMDQLLEMARSCFHQS
jgi:CheY-like chemotaxis protein